MDWSLFTVALTTTFYQAMIRGQSVLLDLLETEIRCPRCGKITLASIGNFGRNNLSCKWCGYRAGEFVNARSRTVNDDRTVQVAQVAPFVPQVEDLQLYLPYKLQTSSIKPLTPVVVQPRLAQTIFDERQQPVDNHQLSLGRQTFFHSDAGQDATFTIACPRLAPGWSAAMEVMVKIMNDRGGQLFDGSYSSVVRRLSDGTLLIEPFSPSTHH